MFCEYRVHMFSLNAYFAFQNLRWYRYVRLLCDSTRINQGNKGGQRSQFGVGLLFFVH